MSFKDKFTSWINVSDDKYIESSENKSDTGFDFEPEKSEPTVQTQAKSNVFHFKNDKSSSAPNAASAVQPKQATPAKPKVVLQKVVKFEDVYRVADILKEKRIVVLNLEHCPNEISQRVIDILFGVSYANNGSFEKIAGRAYIITPDNVPVSGENSDRLQELGALSK